jgi:hypothetical protein
MLRDQLTVVVRITGADHQRQRKPAARVRRQGSERRRHRLAEAAGRAEEDQQDPLAPKLLQLHPLTVEVRQLERGAVDPTARPLDGRADGLSSSSSRSKCSRMRPFCRTSW